MERKKRPSGGAAIGGILVALDQQVFRTVPPAIELVHHARPDTPAPTRDGGLVVVLPPERPKAEADDNEGQVPPIE